MYKSEIYSSNKQLKTTEMAFMFQGHSTYEAMLLTAVKYVSSKNANCVEG